MNVKDLTSELKDEIVTFRGWAHAIRTPGKKMAFIIIRQKYSTVQCVLSSDETSPEMIKFVKTLNRESVLDVEGIVSLPSEPIKGATQQVEIQVTKIYCVSKPAHGKGKGVPVLPFNVEDVLPFNVEDAARSEIEIQEALKDGKHLVRVNQDTRLNFRVLDLRAPAHQAILTLSSQLQMLFAGLLDKQGFCGIHTPRIIEGVSEGGSAVFTFNYFGKTASLAQSTQLHKQMAILGGFRRVFEIGSVYRAERSSTHRHLCEFTGLDVEMEIMEHYSEVMDIVDLLFVSIFDTVHEKCSEELEVINKQYPFSKLKYLRETLRLTFEEGVQMLKEAGVEIDPLEDLNTESERKLGQLVLEKYGTEFYILHKYPLAVRPFFTMPCPDDPKYGNAFDAFLRGEEIISGSQRIHEPDVLEKCAKACGIDVKNHSMSKFIDSFRYGAPRGGFGAGLERVVMLFCGLDNIRKTSLFPCDPQRIAP